MYRLTTTMQVKTRPEPLAIGTAVQVVPGTGARRHLAPCRGVVAGAIAAGCDNWRYDIVVSRAEFEQHNLYCLPGNLVDTMRVYHNEVKQIGPSPQNDEEAETRFITLRESGGLPLFEE